MEFKELLYKRRSYRSFTGGTMNRSQLSYILDAAACEVLGLSERYRPVALAVIGTVSDEVPLRDRKPTEEVVTIIGDLPKEETAEEASVQNRPYVLKHAYLPGASFDDLYLGNDCKRKED